MWMDETTRKELGLDECLHRFRPLTPMGKEAARELEPFLPGQEKAWQRLLVEQEAIQGRLAGHPRMREVLASLLEEVPDPAESLRLLEAGESLTLTGWFRVKRFLWQLREWDMRMKELGMPEPLRLDDAAAALCESLLVRLNPDPPLKPSFSLDDGFDPRLGPLRKELRSLERTLGERRRERAVAVEKEYGLRPNRFGEWVADRSSPSVARFRKDPRLRLVRETAVDAVFALDEAEDAALLQELEAVRERLEEMEREALERLAPAFRPHLAVLRGWREQLLHFDLQWARLRAAVTWQGTRPVHDPARMTLVGAVHPPLADRLREQGMAFVPMDLEIQPGATVIIGANMGGKTVALRTAGLAAALGQLGFFVPAASCRMPLFPWIGGVIGDGQDPERGLSSFGAEVVRLRGFLERPEPGLMLLDEVGRGTNPLEGAALSRAVTEVLGERPAWSVHVTHFREALRIPGIRGYRTAGIRKEEWELPERSDERDLLRRIAGRMDFRLVPLTGEEDVPEEALFIAEALGLPSEVIRRARQALHEGKKRTEGEEENGWNRN